MDYNHQTQHSILYSITRGGLYQTLYYTWETLLRGV